MLDVKGMTKAGVERKATCRALFSKLLYLAGEQWACSFQLAVLPPSVSLAAYPVLLDCSLLQRMIASQHKHMFVFAPFQGKRKGSNCCICATASEFAGSFIRIQHVVMLLQLAPACSCRGWLSTVFHRLFVCCNVFY